MNLIAGDPTITLLIGFIALAVVVFGILSPRSFLSMDTVKSMAFQMPELGILSLAMMVPLMSGGLNLAIIATANLAGLVIAAVVTNLIQPSSPPLAVTGSVFVEPVIQFGLLRPLRRHGHKRPPKRL